MAQKILFFCSIIFAAILAGCVSTQEHPETDDTSYALDFFGSAPGSREIAEGVYNFTLGRGTHSMFIVGSEDVAVFETFDTPHSQALLEAVRAVTDKPITHVFMTHNHWDHSSGSGVFNEAGAQTVMHQLAATWLEANPGPDTTPPTMVWRGDRQDVAMSNFTVEMHYLGQNHGLGMTVFKVPERKVVYIADLVAPSRLPFTIMPDYNVPEWERTLRELLEWDFEIAVCAHNQRPGTEVLEGCTRNDIAEELQFLVDLREAVIAELESGTNFFDVPTSVELPQYAHWAAYDEWLELNAHHMLMLIALGPYPWFEEAPDEEQ